MNNTAATVISCVTAISFLALPLREAVAGGDDVASCIRNSDLGQDLRDKGQLLESREAFVSCSRDGCPGQIRTSCADWLAGLGPRIPTLIIAGKDLSGHDVTDGQAYLDGKKIEGALSGRAFLVNPGPHKLRVEHEGSPPAEVSLSVREGEQRRIVPVVFQYNPTEPEKGQPPAGTDPETLNGTKGGSSGPPLASWLIAGGGALALVGGAAVGLLGVSQFNDLKGGCGKTSSCQPSDISSVRSKLVLSDVLVVSGLLAIGVGIVVWILDKPAANEKPKSAGRHIAPSATGWSVSF